MQQPDWNVLPFGYSTPQAQERLAILMEDERTILVDIRYSTKSVRKPEWSGEALQQRYGNRYLWIRDLGNENFFNGGDIKIHDKDQGIPRLMKGIERGYKLIMLCTCQRYDTCHRRTVVEMLCSQMPGVKVMRPELPAGEGGNAYMQREWTEQPGKIACLSIAQPFCSGIIEGKKSIELRTWGTHYRGIIALHAGSKWYGGVDLSKSTFRAEAHQIRAIREAVQRLGTSREIADYPTGSIIGMARLVQCRRFVSLEEYESLRPAHQGSTEWDERDYGWWFEDVVKLEEPVKVRGYLGLFGVDRGLSPTILYLMK